MSDDDRFLVGGEDLEGSRQQLGAGLELGRQGSDAWLTLHVDQPLTSPLESRVVYELQRQVPELPHAKPIASGKMIIEPVNRDLVHRIDRHLLGEPKAPAAPGFTNLDIGELEAQANPPVARQPHQPWLTLHVDQPLTSPESRVVYELQRQVPELPHAKPIAAGEMIIEPVNRDLVHRIESPDLLGEPAAPAAADPLEPTARWVAQSPGERGPKDAIPPASNNDEAPVPGAEGPPSSAPPFPPDGGGRGPFDPPGSGSSGGGTGDNGGPRPVGSGFSRGDDPLIDLGNSTPLEPDQPYHLWLELGQGITTPSPPVDVDIALFDYYGELELDPTADVASLTLRADGSVAVLRHGGFHSPGRTSNNARPGRVFFPIRTPSREGRHRVRCNVYHNRLLLQSSVLSVEVRSRTTPWRSFARRFGRYPPSFTRELDYVLSHTLSPEHLGQMRPHQLSIMLNDSADHTHGFRVYGKDGFKSTASFDGHELQTHGELMRNALRRAASNTNSSKQSPTNSSKQSPGEYRYAGAFDEDRLSTDLIMLARWGWRLYSTFVHRLASGIPGGETSVPQRFARLLRYPSRIQLSNKVSARHVFPAAMMYDHRLDAGLENLRLCPAFVADLGQQADLATTACFQGHCPSLEELDVVCPSGFWGFRHVISVPQSVGGAGPFPVDMPLSIVSADRPLLAVALSTDPRFVMWKTHELVLRSLDERIEWRQCSSRQQLFELFPSIEPHLVYFYCHGGVDASGIPFIQVGPPDEPVITGDALLSHQVIWDKTRPLVFINGCHTTAIGPQTALELVTAFVDHSFAAGVIGTETTVFEPLASSFAEEFMRRLVVAGDPVGDAVQGARLALLQRGNPLGLAYVPFVSGDLRLVRERSAVSAGK